MREPCSRQPDKLQGLVISFHLGIEFRGVTFEMGMYKFILYLRIARDRRTTNTANAAFSKSVGWTSIERNSTRQPIGEFTGGGLKRRVCQFVD